MTRPPRNPKTPLLPSQVVWWGIFQGTMALVATGGIFFLAEHRNLGDSQSRSLAFLTMMSCNFALIFVNRSYSTSIMRILQRRNPMLWSSTIVVPTILLAIFAIKDLRTLFGFASVTTDQLLMAMAPACIILVILEKSKILWRKSI